MRSHSLSYRRRGRRPRRRPKWRRPRQSRCRRSRRGKRRLSGTPRQRSRSRSGSSSMTCTARPSQTRCTRRPASRGRVVRAHASARARGVGLGSHLLVRLDAERQERSLQALAAERALDQDDLPVRAAAGATLRPPLSDFATESSCRHTLHRAVLLFRTPRLCAFIGFSRLRSCMRSHSGVDRYRGKARQGKAVKASGTHRGRSGRLTGTICCTRCTRPIRRHMRSAGGWRPRPMPIGPQPAARSLAQ